MSVCLNFFKVKTQTVKRRRFDQNFLPLPHYLSKKVGFKNIWQQQYLLTHQISMSFGVYRYQHSEFGPIMLLLDSEPEKPEAVVIENNRYNTKHIEETIEYEKRSIEKNRGRSIRNSHISYYSIEKSIQKQKTGSLQKIKKRAEKGVVEKAAEKGLQLPMIPKGNKRKIQI